jgi:cytochrome P450
MRLNPVLGQTFRTNRADDVLPLATPMYGTDGKMHNEIIVQKGTWVVVDIASANRRKDVWGEDAETFNPERWLKTAEDEAVPLTKTPGVVYGSLLNFLAGSECLTESVTFKDRLTFGVR